MHVLRSGIGMYVVRGYFHAETLALINSRRTILNLSIPPGLSRSAHVSRVKKNPFGSSGDNIVCIFSWKDFMKDCLFMHCFHNIPYNDVYTECLNVYEMDFDQAFQQIRESPLRNFLLLTLVDSCLKKCWYLKVVCDHALFSLSPIILPPTTHFCVVHGSIYNIQFSSEKLVHVSLAKQFYLLFVRPKLGSFYLTT